MFFHILLIAFLVGAPGLAANSYNAGTTDLFYSVKHPVIEHTYKVNE